MKRSLVTLFVVLVSLFSTASAQEGVVSPYLEQDADHDNVGFIITPAQANASAQPDADYVERVQAGWNDNGLGIWAVCGLQASSIGTKYQILLCLLTMSNGGDERVTISVDDIAFVEDSGYRNQAMQDAYAYFGEQALTSASIPPGQKMEAGVAFLVSSYLSFPVMVEINPVNDPWDHSIVLIADTFIQLIA